MFSGPVPTHRVFDFLRWLTQDHAEHGIAYPVETFPKQSRIEPGRFGNWLRLPGRHHTRDHWSRVWDGTQWLAGPEAVGFILSLAGDSPSLIPADVTFLPSPLARPAPSPTLANTPSQPNPDCVLPLGLEGRIRAYMARLPAGLGEGQHRDDYAFGFACFLARDLALQEADALTWLTEWDQRQAVPKGDDRLREILDNAKKYGRRPIGCGLRRQRLPKSVTVKVEV